MKWISVFSIFAAAMGASSVAVAQKPPLQGQGRPGIRQLKEVMAGKPGDSAAAIQLVHRMFGRNNLLSCKSAPKVDGTIVAWAIIEKQPASVVREDGALIGAMTPLGDEGLQVLVADVPNFTEFNYRVEAGGMTRLAGNLHIEHFEPPVESQIQPGVPRGRIETFDWNASQIFPRTHRRVSVYIPAQYKSGDEACLMVWQDGSRHADPAGQMRVPVVFDNLIHKDEMPVTIGVFVDPGRGPRQKPEDRAANRGFEYDSLGDAYVRFLLTEILPEVEKRFAVKFRSDPASRAIAGGSSGGICAFTAAWERPDQFGKVLSWVGSFVDLRGGHVYPSLIRLTERKPIRVYLLDGANDLDNKFGNWPIANRQMEAALRFMKYDFRIDWTECFHGSKGISAHLPEALRWLWRVEGLKG